MPREDGPAAHVRRLKAAGQPVEPDDDVIPPTLVELHGGDRAAAREAVRKARGADQAVMLLDHLVPRLPDGFRKLIDDDVIAVGTVLSPEPNAHHDRLGPLAYAITINSGLIAFVYRVARALSTRAAPAGTDGEITLSFDDTCRVVTDIFFWFAEAGRSAGPDYPVTRTQIAFASRLAVEAECFFLAHEIGHAMYDILGLSGKRPPPVYGTGWDEELFADQWALTAVVGGRVPTADDTRIVGYAGAELALGIFHALEQLGVRFAGSHPPFQTRLDAIRNHARSACVDAHSYAALASLARTIDALMSEVVRRISAPDWDEFLQRVADDVVAKFDRLLDRCSGGFVPDYMSFYTAVNDLFNQGFSHRLYERIVRVTHAFFDQTRERVENPEGAGSREAWVAFQKYKLILGATQNLREPARSVFEQALRPPTPG